MLLPHLGPDRPVLPYYLVRQCCGYKIKISVMAHFPLEDHMFLMFSNQHCKYTSTVIIFHHRKSQVRRQQTTITEAIACSWKLLSQSGKQECQIPTIV